MIMPSERVNEQMDDVEYIEHDALKIIDEYSCMTTCFGGHCMLSYWSIQDQEACSRCSYGGKEISDLQQSFNVLSKGCARAGYRKEASIGSCRNDFVAMVFIDRVFRLPRVEEVGK
ncbi:uncharacterized protein A4U43_C02F21780 [Asparagus officinalis]|uniref:Uncharacterized protein n=1 Tax=Asparagus officinalis TaxID=4686 RepID=A0A5P1FK28_ASPOF|nr:uncharacterized protein A4U43_C02F21780 [Asparagus officinalis]